MKLVLIWLLVIIGGGYSALIYQYDGHVYYVSTPEMLTWYDSIRFCNERGMHLVEIYNENENAIIQSVIKNVKSGNFWTGGTNFGGEGRFYWASTGHLFIYTNWVEPKNGTSITSCVYYDSTRQHRWNILDCNHKLYFICRNTVEIPVYEDRKCSIV